MCRASRDDPSQNALRNALLFSSCQVANVTTGQVAALFAELQPHNRDRPSSRCQTAVQEREQTSTTVVLS